MFSRIESDSPSGGGKKVQLDFICAAKGLAIRSLLPQNLEWASRYLLVAPSGTLTNTAKAEELMPRCFIPSKTHPKEPMACAISKRAHSHSGTRTCLRRHSWYSQNRMLPPCPLYVGPFGTTWRGKAVDEDSDEAGAILELHLAIPSARPGRA
jgi:hypothetical protein